MQSDLLTSISIRSLGNGQSGDKASAHMTAVLYQQCHNEQDTAATVLWLVATN